MPPIRDAAVLILDTHLVYCPGALPVDMITIINPPLMLVPNLSVIAFAMLTFASMASAFDFRKFCIDWFASSILVDNRAISTRYDANTASTLCFSAGVTLPSDITALMVAIRLSTSPKYVTFAFKRFVLGVPVRNWFVYNLLYVASSDAFSASILFIYVSIAFASASSITPSWNAPSMYVSRSSIIPLISSTSWLAAFAAASAAAAAALAPSASSFRYCSIEILASSSRVVKRSNDELYVVNAASTACFSAGVVAPSANGGVDSVQQGAMSPKCNLCV